MRNLRIKGLGHEDPRGQRARFVPEVNQSELARRAGVSRYHVNRWLNGKSLPTMGNLIKLAAAIGKTLDETSGWLREIGERSRRTKAKG